MNAAPAKVAGVHRLVMTVPSPEGRINPLVLVAAKLAGVDEFTGWWSTSDRGAGLWNADDRASRQDRRSRQCLCGCGQAKGF